MKKVIAIVSGTLVAFVLPLISLAATSIANVKDVGTFVIDTINNVLVPVLFAVAFIIFVWGAFQTFIVGSGSEDVKEKGKSLMLWGLIGFFVMMSVWGLVNILTGTVGLNANVTAPTTGTIKVQ